MQNNIINVVVADCVVPVSDSCNCFTHYFHSTTYTIYFHPIPLVVSICLVWSCHKEREYLESLESKP